MEHHRSPPPKVKPPYESPPKPSYKPAAMNEEDFNALVRQEMMKMEAEFAAMIDDELPEEDHSSHQLHDRHSSSHTHQHQAPLSARDRNHQKQAEYARQLAEDQAVRLQTIEQQNTNRSSSNARGRPPSDRDDSHSGLFIGNSSQDNRAKLSQQQLYAQQLASDAKLKQSLSHHPPNHRNSQHHTPSRQPLQNDPTITVRTTGRNPHGKMSQAEYAQQLEHDLYVKRQLEQQNGAPDKYRNGTPERHERHRSQEASPIVSSRSDGQLSTRDHSRMRQQNYAQQLAEDQRRKQEIERTPEKPRHIRAQPASFFDKPSETGLAIGHSDDRGDKRLKQMEYARQLREAAQAPVLASPRQSIRRHSDHEPSGTSIALPGQVSTAIRRETKRHEQERYRAELDAAARAQPMPSQRETRARRDVSSGITTAGLIGHQETEYQRREAKRFEQERYRAELDAASKASPMPSQRESRIQRNSSAGITTAGLIGHQETEQERRMRKREQQQLYQQQLNAQKSYSSPQYKREEMDDGGRGSQVLHKEVSASHYEQPGRQYRQAPSPQYREAPRQYTPDNDYHQYREPPRAYQYEYQADGDYEPLPLSPQRRSMLQEMDVSEEEYQQMVYDSVMKSRMSRDDHAAPRDAPSSNHIEYRASQSAPVAPVVPIPKSDPYAMRPHDRGTGLMIGGMNVMASDDKERKYRQQQQYAREIAEAAAAPAISTRREEPYERQAYVAPQATGKGRSSGGGASSIILGGDSPKRFHRNGTQEEMAAKLRYEIR